MTDLFELLAHYLAMSRISSSLPYLFFHTGLRFSMRARRPSWES